MFRNANTSVYFSCCRVANLLLLGLYVYLFKDKLEDHIYLGFKTSHTRYQKIRRGVKDFQLTDSLCCNNDVVAFEGWLSVERMPCKES